MGWGGRWVRGSGWGIHVNPWLIHINVWQKPLQYCKVIQFSSVQSISVAQWCLTLCNPMNHSTPGLPVHHQLPELLKLMSIESVMPSSHLILCHPFSFCPQSLPASGSFPMSQLFASGGQSTGVSASASVLPMNTQA